MLSAFAAQRIAEREAVLFSAADLVGPILCHVVAFRLSTGDIIATFPD
jgi:hypothetical protein